MIQRAIERYDEKQDKRFSETNARLDRNVHETRNLRQSVTDQFYLLKENMGQQITAGHAQLGQQLDSIKSSTGAQFESIKISLGASSGVNKYKEYIWPTIFAAILAIIGLLELLKWKG